MAIYTGFTVNQQKSISLLDAYNKGYFSFIGDGLGVGGQTCSQYITGYINTEIPANYEENKAACPQVIEEIELQCIGFHKEWSNNFASFTIPSSIQGNSVKYAYLTIHPLHINDLEWQEITNLNCGPVNALTLTRSLCFRYRDDNDILHYSPVLSNISYMMNFINGQKLTSVNPDVVVYNPETGTYGPQEIQWGTYYICDLGLAGWSNYDPVVQEFFGTPYTNAIINISGIRFYADPSEGDEWIMNITPTDVDTFDISNKMSKILQLGKTELNNLFENVLFNSDPDIMSSVIDGLKLYGQDPANLIISLMQVPFSPSESSLATVGGAQSSITVGSYGPTTIGQFNEITQLKTKPLGTINLASTPSVDFPLKNDWHDYLSYSLYIYLPYAGIYALNVEKYMHDDISVKAMFDVRTGSLKYYIFSDTKCLDMFEGQCGINCPFSASDKNAAASLFKSSIGSTISGLGGVIGGGAALVGGAIGANPLAVGAGIAGMAAGINGMAQGLSGLSAPVPMTVSGGFGGSSNIFDDTHAKLIQVYQPYIDDGIVTSLGKPQNVFGSLNVSGYIEAKDIRLVSGRSKRMQDLCKQALAEGCIL